MRITEFDIYKDLLREKSGMVLTPDKSYVLESRLGPIARKWGFNSMEGLTQALSAVPEKALVNDVIEAMANHETSFFRDMPLYDTLADKVLPYLIDARASAKKLRIWISGASSGQEPYSIAIMLKEKFPQLGSWKIDILATDISHEVIEYAKLGVYSQFEVQRGMPIRLLIRHFNQSQDTWKLRDDIRKMVDFKQMNLLEPMKAQGRFDLVLCCDVLNGFDPQTRESVLNEIAGQLAPDGFLCIGSAEDPAQINDAFANAFAPGIYGLADGPHSNAD